MAHSIIHERVQPVKQELFNFVNWSSKLPMEDEEDFADYFERFQSLGNRLLFFRAISKWECNKLFWQGLHPKDRTALYPYILNKRPNQQPGANLGVKVQDLLKVRRARVGCGVCFGSTRGFDP